MKAGIVKYFNNDRGFGFLLPDDGSDSIFFHESSVIDAGEIKKGQRARFDVEPNERRQGSFKAVRVELCE